ncbi:FKBP-type peptidyl-prolyl cis-trans isomerase [Erythrobacter sp. YT30]|uniref:FKBP-type peptidyl-prolyl cis-trans isomerase n=1 Tax=Erythrobacter sp. YT30 TaxID=1735012 RepID=UPI00076D795C|nr:FKBP-type peptidyl-prolyl cis-trans isomerase [Erythrobacter sp. YT30]KWV90350.1 peptidylprolyl isomerase [Erythrobacter sp. YT30]
MAEVTRVPIQPVAKGSLTKLWLGIFIAILVGAGIAWAAIPKTLEVETLVEGEGDFAQEGDLAFVKYTGTLASTGEEFDKWRPEQLPIPGIFPEGTAFEIQKGAVVDGFFEGLQQMKKGGKYKLYIPASMGYGATPPPGSSIPPNADLIFEVEMVDFFNEEQLQNRINIMQQAIQAQNPQGLGGPGGPAGGPAGGPPPAQNVPGPPPVQSPGP